MPRPGDHRPERSEYAESEAGTGLLRARTCEQVSAAGSGADWVGRADGHTSKGWCFPEYQRHDCALCAERGDHEPGGAHWIPRQKGRAHLAGGSRGHIYLEALARITHAPPTYRCSVK